MLWGLCALREPLGESKRLSSEGAVKGGDSGMGVTSTSHSGSHSPFCCECPQEETSGGAAPTPHWIRAVPRVDCRGWHSPLGAPGQRAGPCGCGWLTARFLPPSLSPLGALCPKAAASPRSTRCWEICPQGLVRAGLRPGRAWIWEPSDGPPSSELPEAEWGWPYSNIICQLLPPPTSPHAICTEMPTRCHLFAGSPPRDGQEHTPTSPSATVTLTERKLAGAPSCPPHLQNSDPCAQGPPCTAVSISFPSAVRAVGSPPCGPPRPLVLHPLTRLL